MLADVFENFRETSFEYYSLDPANYLSLPSFAWDAMLNMTGIKLEQIHDYRVMDIMERQKKGGLCFVGSKRHAIANNKYLPTYDETKPENYLLYLDANNLYGGAMSQYLPYDKVKMNDKVNLEKVLATADDAEEGYIVECDLTFPIELHDKFKEFPPCPESLTPNTKWMSDYQKAMLSKHDEGIAKKLAKGEDVDVGRNKLIPHLMEHKNYCIHYRNLKFVKDLGVKIGIVHNIVSFKQKEWLKEYIDFNTAKRTKAKNDFEKDFFKLMNNAVFGKTMENVKNRMNLHLTTCDDNAVKWFSKFNYKNCNEIDGLYLIEMYKTEIIYDKPMYVGTSVLDLSKLCMMEFHYNVIHKEFEGKYNLLYSDTDSLIYDIRDPDIYKWIGNNKDHFDLSDSLRPELKNNKNKKVICKYKDEMNSLIIKEAVFENPKVYSIIHQEMEDNVIDENHNTKKAKGVSKVVLKKEITHKDFVDVLETGKSISKDVISIRSFDHQLYTVKQKKVVLTSWYDKMNMISNVECVPYGYRN